ncbi:type I methionyl aminopeptidase [Thalassoglobus sp. JC818]|uniref:type I methionyl aminopeptidase n=1 Tax=Thalassoglobus sp. JC818 TaxID=3232136 RepID=UPI00345A492B
MITLKSKREIGLMRDAGELVARAHRIVREMIEPGVTTLEIDQAVEEFFAAQDAEPLFKGYPGEGTTPFPSVTCMSPNEQVVHGIPSTEPLKSGDILSVDTGCRIHGWCGDAAWTYPVGDVDAESQHLLDVGEEMLNVAIEQMGRQKKWSTVAKKMMKLAKTKRLSLVEQFVGHGIGREMHEGPQVPNYTTESLQRDDFELQPGLVLAVEPMLNGGTSDIRVLKDQWTVVTADGKRSVHFEHTVALTEDGPIRLTEGVGEK